MKFASDRPCANPETAARKLIEIANSVEAVQDGRIYIELINWPFLYEAKGSPGDTLPDSSWRSTVAGYGCTSPEPMSGLPKRERSYSSKMTQI